MLVLFTDVGYSRMILILPAALLFGAAASLFYTVGTGLFVARSVMRPLARRSPNSVMVAALAITIVLMETARLAADTRTLWLPPLLNTAVVFWRDGDFRVTLTVIQLINVGLMGLIIAIGAAILRLTAWGRIWRAVTDDGLAAELCGISAGRVFLVAYGASVLVATLCGILSTGYYGTMNVSDGLLFGLKILLIAAVGGYADPLKSAGGAAFLALFETMWDAYGPFLWRDFTIFSLLVFLLVLSRRERAIP